MAIPQALQREILAVVVLLFAVLTAISLRGGDSAGILSAWGAALTAVFGWAAWLAPLAIAAAGVMLFVAGLLKIDRLRWEMPLGICLILGGVVGLAELSLTSGQSGAAPRQTGGMVGEAVSGLVQGIAGRFGGGVILLALIIIGVIMAFHLSIGDLMRLLGRGGGGLISLFTAQPPTTAKAASPPPVTVMPQAAAPRLPRPAAEDDGLPHDIPRILGGATVFVPAAPPAIGAQAKPERAKPPVGEPAPAVQLSLPTPGTNGMVWRLPEVTQLEKAGDIEVNDGDLRRKASKIEEVLATFGVSAKVPEIHPGPAVTQFAVVPGEGVRVAKIAALANDLALALEAPSIRIEAPVPGMAYVGVEVPNITPGLVGLRNILETESFKHNRGKLRVPLGRDTNNQPVITDLAKLPHLLIAGATGSGKSVAINSLIVSFLMQYTPDELRMLMIDPKRVELSGFNGIPHLLRPVVTEMKSEKDPASKGPRPLTAIEILKWLLWEMERRYKMFAHGGKDSDGISRGVRNIEQYHAAAHTDPMLAPMPYIVLVIDELADLMLNAPEDVETSICRLAQLARATGIHLIIATQRPSVDVVTGLIKANFPARIAFAVTSMIDSRVILDTPGAEKLLGRGDALYTASDESKPIRVQGTFVSDRETERVVQFWRKQLPEAAHAGEQDAAQPNASQQVGGIALAAKPVQLGANVPMPDWLAEAEAGGDSVDEDEMLKKAIVLVKKHRYASTSMLQRRLRLGYNRAERLIEKMEEMGIVGPQDGTSGRSVLLGEDGENGDGADT